MRKSRSRQAAEHTHWHGDWSHSTLTLKELCPLSLRLLLTSTPTLFLNSSACGWYLVIHLYSYLVMTELQKPKRFHLVARSQR